MQGAGILFMSAGWGVIVLKLIFLVDSSEVSDQRFVPFSFLSNRSKMFSTVVFFHFLRFLMIPVAGMKRVKLAVKCFLFLCLMIGLINT